MTDEKTKKHNIKLGVGSNQFGAKLGDIRKLAKKIKSDSALAYKLLETNNFDAQMLSMLLFNPKELDVNAMDKIVRKLSHDRVTDYFNSYVAKKHKDKEQLREMWMKDNHPMAARVGWYMTAECIAKTPEQVDVEQTLDRLDKEMGTANPSVQWSMNFSLVETGINHPKLRKRALEIGERLGIYKEYPAAKGCISPYAPIWINEMVSRQK